MVIGAPTGTAVKAIASGRVILAGHLNGYGYMVIVKHGDSDLSLYGFNQAVFVKQGQLVSAGQTIAQWGIQVSSQNRRFTLELAVKECL